MRKDGLISGGVPEMRVLRKNVMDKGSAAAPMTQNEQRIEVQGFVGQLFFVLSILKRHTDTQYSTYSLREQKFCLFLLRNMLIGGHSLESIPICTDQRIDRQLAKLYQSHSSMIPTDLLLNDFYFQSLP